jgi:hypothetical protein
MLTGMLARVARSFNQTGDADAPANAIVATTRPFTPATCTSKLLHPHGINAASCKTRLFGYPRPAGTMQGKKDRQRQIFVWGVQPITLAQTLPTIEGPGTSRPRSTSSAELFDATNHRGPSQEGEDPRHNSFFRKDRPICHPQRARSLACA